MKSGFRSVKNSLTALFLFLAVMFLGMGGWKVNTMMIDPNWATVDGFIVTSELETHTVDSHDAQAPTTIFYDAVIYFQYIVNGRTYQHSHVLGGVSRNDPATARQTLEAYPEGTVIRIVYNTEDPNEAKIHTKTLCSPVICFLLALLSFGAAFVCQRIKEKEEHVPPMTISRRKPVRPIEKPDALSQSVLEVIPPSDPRHGLTGHWCLDYQIPSMREIISSSQKGRKLQGDDRAAVLSSGTESLVVTITPNNIKFAYKDSKNDGSCDILSRYNLSGNRMALEHLDMDFLMTDIPDFPPTSFTVSQKGDKLTLVSEEIEGLGKRKVSYYLSRCVE